MQGKGIAGHQLCTLTAHALLSTKWYLYVIVTDCSQTTLRLCTAVMERWLDSIKSQVKILRLSFLGQHPFSAEDEVMAEEKGNLHLLRSLKMDWPTLKENLVLGRG